MPDDTHDPSARGPGSPPPSRRAAREQAQRRAAREVEREDPATEASPSSSPSSNETAQRSAPLSDRSEAPPRPAIDPNTAASHRSLPPTEQAPSQPAQPSAAGYGSASASAPEHVSASQRAATMTLDDLMTDDVEAAPSKKERRRRRRIGGWVALIVVLVLGGLIAGGAWWVWSTFEPQIRAVMGWEEPRDFEPGNAHGEVMVTIADGDGGRAISETLFSAGVTKTEGAFYDHLVATGDTTVFYPGLYRLQLEMSSADALTALQDPENRLENGAQVREGLTVDQTIDILAEGIDLSREDFEAAVADPSVYGVDADSLEGWLFPATYTFDEGTTAQAVIQRMVDRTVQSLDAAEVPVDQRQRILTIASIIEREARLPDDFYRVARVIENRLDDGMLLQMDSTAQFGFGQMHDGRVSSSAEALQDDNAWNTYVVQGLPAGPIANPGDRAIDAAMHPADGPWLYFVTWNMDTGETIFSETYAEHEEGIKVWDQWCLDNDNRGC